MSSGELIVDDNQIKPAVSTLPHDWANEFQTQHNANPNSWAEQFAQDQVNYFDLLQLFSCYR